MWKHLANLKRPAMSGHVVDSEPKVIDHLFKSQMEKLRHLKVNRGIVYVVVVSSNSDYK